MVKKTDEIKDEAVVEVKAEAKVEAKSDRQIAWEAFLVKYKASNPAKYALKKLEGSTAPESFK